MQIYAMENKLPPQTGAATSLLALAAAISVLVLGACVPEKTVIYSERLAVLPDQSGYLGKDVRTLDPDKSRTEMAIIEVAGKTTREVFVIALDGFADVKFKARIKGDTLILSHTQPALDKALKPVAVPAHPIRFQTVSGPEWLSAGMEEGHALFYAQDKWKGVIELLRQP
jgi:hypothetical protein